MELYQYSDRICYSAYEEERDRPALGYIRGDRYSIAVDAGHSEAHLNEFYDALRKKDLPLPEITVITHWHWDHSFAMHRINGVSLANRMTDSYLRYFIENRTEESDQEFLNLDPSISKEYEGGRKEIIVIPADIVYEDKVILDCGNLKVEVFECVSPHTDDATLIYVPDEKVLFIGDCISGVFPSWIADPVLLKQLIEKLETIDAKYIIGGHWPIFSKEALLKQLREEL